jgi:hypothetical protein
MPRHVDMTAKVFFLGIERRNLAAFIRRQKSFDHRAALTAQLLQNLPQSYFATRLLAACTEDEFSGLS